MKHVSQWSLGLLLALATLASAEQLDTTLAAPQVFEYAMVELPKQFHEPCTYCDLDKNDKNHMLSTINEWARAGWRLVTILRGGHNEPIGIFERPTVAPLTRSQAQPPQAQPPR